MRMHVALAGFACAALLAVAGCGDGKDKKTDKAASRFNSSGTNASTSAEVVGDAGASTGKSSRVYDESELTEVALNVPNMT